MDGLHSRRPLHLLPGPTTRVPRSLGSGQWLPPSPGHEFWWRPYQREQAKHDLPSPIPERTQPSQPGVRVHSDLACVALVCTSSLHPSGRRRGSFLHQMGRTYLEEHLLAGNQGLDTHPSAHWSVKASGPIRQNDQFLDLCSDIGSDTTEIATDIQARTAKLAVMIRTDIVL